MARVSTYLNFDGNAEEAFAFYATTFGTELQGPMMRFGDVPEAPGQPPLAPDERSKVMHAELPILGGHVLMATDVLMSMGQTLRIGNNSTLNLEPDSRAEADELYRALSEGGADSEPMRAMPWGAYWGCTLDRFGVRWMINVMD